MLSGLLLTFLATVSALAQPSSDSTFPSFYFDTLGYTETWLDLTPPPQPGDAASAITLNLTIRYAGRPVTDRLPAAPLAIVIRAQSNPQYKPMFLRQPILSVDADGQPLWDTRLKVNFYSRNASPCEGCSTSADIVDLEVPEDVIRRMAAARELAGNAFGMRFALSPAQVQRILEFVEHALGPA